MRRTDDSKELCGTDRPKTGHTQHAAIAIALASFLHHDASDSITLPLVQIDILVEELGVET